MRNDCGEHICRRTSRQCAIAITVAPQSKCRSSLPSLPLLNFRFGFKFSFPLIEAEALQSSATLSATYQYQARFDEFDPFATIQESECVNTTVSIRGSPF